MVSVKFLVKKYNIVLTNSIDTLYKIVVKTVLIYSVLTIYLNNEDKMYTCAPPETMSSHVLINVSSVVEF